MKKTLTFALILSLLATMFMSVPVMAAGEMTITSGYTAAFGELKAAIEDPDGPDVILINTDIVTFTSTITVNRPVEIKTYPGRSTPARLMTDSTLPANGRHFLVNSGASLTLEDITIWGNTSSTPKGGIVVVGGELFMTDSKISTCGQTVGYATGPVAGALLVDGGFAVLTGCGIENGYTNSTSNTYRSTGILAINGAEVIISDTSFANNWLFNPANSNANPSIQTDGTADVWFGDNVTFSPGSTSQEYAKRGDGVVSWNHVNDINDANKLENRPVPVDKSALQELYDANIDRENDGYTDESWAVLQAALEEAGLVLDDANATQAEVDEAFDTLSDALESLEVLVPVTGVKINSVATTTIRKGKTLLLSATLTPLNANAGTEITWSSSNEAAVKVDAETGLITGVKAGGNARITATSSNGIAHTITVTVES